MLRQCVISRVSLLRSNAGRIRWFSSVPTSGSKPSQAEDVQELNNFFPAVVDAARRAVQPFNIPSESKWLERVLEYNVERVRMPGTIVAYNAMRELSGQAWGSTDTVQKAKSMAWCTELLNTSYTMVDDIIDGGAVRWDRTAWHLLPDVRLAAVCDAFLLENTAFQLLRQQFKGSPYYADLVDMHMDTNLGTNLGQNDDNRNARPGRAMEDDFTMARYEMAARLKTGVNSFYNPVVSSFLAHGVNNPRTFATAEDIALDLSVIFMMQDDFHDCFGDDNMDMSMDIKNGTCSWMILEAKRIANADQLQILKDNYGYDDESKVDAVKAVFRELPLKQRLLDHRHERSELVKAKIEENGHVIPPNIFKYALEVVEQNSVEYISRNTVE